MAVVVYNSLSDVLCRLAHQVFQFLPATVRRDLKPVRECIKWGLGETDALEKYDEFIV
jgi:hypothetical protein